MRVGAHSAWCVRLGQLLVVAWVALIGLRTAHASATYPEQVQQMMSKRLGKPYCVPQCILCHLTNLGGYKTMNVFGSSLEAHAHFGPRQPDKVQGWLEGYFASFAELDSDHDGTADIMEIDVGDSPAVAGEAGEKLVCPDITYGCGARIAPEPSRPQLGPAALLLLGLALFGRRVWTRSRPPGLGARR